MTAATADVDLGNVITAGDIGDVHTYLAQNRPRWKRSMAGIISDGGPWSCDVCGGPSYLIYRCSKCGADLAGDKGGGTQSVGRH